MLNFKLKLTHHMHYCETINVCLFPKFDHTKKLLKKAVMKWRWPTFVAER